MAEQGDDLAPVVANRTTGAVSADVSDADLLVGKPNRWISSVLWLILLLTCSLVAIGSAAALIMDFIAPPPAGTVSSKDTILLLFTTAFTNMIALFSIRPGSR